MSEIESLRARMPKNVIEGVPVGTVSREYRAYSYPFGFETPEAEAANELLGRCEDAVIDFRCLLARQNVPALVGCWSGKDRAQVLHALEAVAALLRESFKNPLIAARDAALEEATSHSPVLGEG